MYKFAIALRFLLSRKIAYISVIAIMFGVMAMIVIMSVMDGFQEKIRGNIRKIDGSLTVNAIETTLFPDASYESIVERLDPYLQKNGGPIIATSKRVTVFAHAMTASRGVYSSDTRTREWGIQLIGIDPKLERNVLPWDELLDDVDDVARQVPKSPQEARENPFDYIDPISGFPASEEGIILGIDLARRLRVARGELVTITTGTLKRDALGEPKIEGVTLRLRVTGCFQTGRYDYDDHFAFCSGRVVKEKLALVSDCASVQVRLADPEAAEAVKMDINKNVKSLRVSSWRDRMQNFAEALDVEKAVMLVITFFIVAMAAASICGILYMLVVEKTRDIGVLLAMGATSSGITSIFVIYGGILGVCGILLGTFAGLEVVWNINEIKDFLDKSLGIQLFPPSVYQFREIPTKVDMHQIVSLGVRSIIVCLVASAIPAFRASRLDPVKCLSYE